VIASIWFYLFPLYILGGMLLLLGVFALLGRVQGGRYLRPIVTGLMKVPLVGRGMRKASQAALERQNPELASAIKKMERLGPAVRDPRRAQAALSSLSPQERRAYLAAVDEEGAMPEAMNREQRRRLEKAKRDSQRGR
jgi:predicted LPLAT superfamily acyltransferase